MSDKNQADAESMKALPRVAGRWLSRPWSALVRLLISTVAAVFAYVVGAAETAGLEPIQYRNPGLVVDLGVGLWAFPMVFDWDGDGDLDLLVSCPDKPFNGVWLFENPGPVGFRSPVFKPPRLVGSPGMQYMTVSTVAGKPRVLVRNAELTGFRNGDWKTQQKIHPTDQLIPIKYQRANTWRYVDFDGDGVEDVLVGQESWDDFGWFDTNDWWRKFDSAGHWTGGLPKGWVSWMKNLGTDAVPLWGPPQPVLGGGVKVETYGSPTPNLADFDGDGDLDLICGEFLDGFTYYQNIGSRTRPRFAAGVRLPVRMDLQMIIPHAVDWDGDGHVDLVVGDEDGRVALVANTGRVKNGIPEFLTPMYFQQEACDIDAGALATPVGVNWDGDGDFDIISGNSAGYIIFFENLSGPDAEQPKFAAGRRLEADGQVVRIQAGINGSIQGPPESKWGYTTLSVADWDGDGLPDLIVNSIWGRVAWYRNIGTRTAPRLAAAQAVEVEWPGSAPKPAWNWWNPRDHELVTQWRTTPVVVDWNSDGLPDLVMLDPEGYLTFYERRLVGGRRVLLPPRRIFCDEAGQPLRLNSGAGGTSGRRKMTIVDWDGDGRLDLLLNSQNAEFWRQTGDRDGSFLFHREGNISARNIEGHDTSPTVVDWNSDGVPDLLIGAEDGRLYYLKNPRTK